MALSMEDKYLLYAAWVRDRPEGREEFLRELERGVPEFSDAIRQHLDLYIAHCITERHFGTYHLDQDQIKFLARSFWECALWLLAGLKAAHGGVPSIPSELLKSTMENFDSQEKISGRYERFHLHEGWIHGFVADADRFHVCGVDFLRSNEPFSGCAYGVGMFLALADTFLAGAEKEKSEAVNRQMQQTAPAFAKFINEDLGGKLDSFGKKEKEG